MARTDVTCGVENGRLIVHQASGPRTACRGWRQGRHSLRVDPRTRRDESLRREECNKA